jgi:F420H(2)-dependent quinone reductase
MATLISEVLTTMPSRDDVLAVLLAHRVVDIVTTGAKTGQPRTTEIWITIITGDLFICGTPNASLPGVERKRRDWLANLIAYPRFTLRLKQDIFVELPAEAEPVRNAAERRRILGSPACEYYLSHSRSLDQAVRDCPMVRVRFVDDASWVNNDLRLAAKDRS